MRKHVVSIVMMVFILGLVLPIQSFADTFEPPAVQEKDIELAAHCRLETVGKWRVVNHSKYEVTISYKLVGQEEMKTKVIPASSQMVLDMPITSKDDKLVIEYGEFHQEVIVSAHNCIPSENNK